jgi:hypothetical protein
VFDSDPKDEDLETMNKMRALAVAIDKAEATVASRQGTVARSLASAGVSGSGSDSAKPAPKSASKGKGKANARPAAEPTRSSKRVKADSKKH